MYLNIKLDDAFDILEDIEKCTGMHVSLEPEIILQCLTVIMLARISAILDD